MPNTQTRRIAAGTLAFLLVAGAGTAAMAENVASVLARDPRFSEYVSAIKTAGLWGDLQHAQDVTIFAPTNDAFAALGFAAVGQDWSAHVLPMHLVDNGEVTLNRAELQTVV